MRDRTFCCLGCQTVHELLQENGLGQYYTLGSSPGRQGGRASGQDRFEFLDDPSVRDRLLDYADERLQKVTFHVPAIHCLACLWLLENLFRLCPGVGASTVQFTRREVSVSFDPTQVTLGRVAGLLDSLGYAPDLNWSDLDTRRGSVVPKRLWLQLGVAGFAFGNTMLFSLPGYFGLDTFSGPAFRHLFGLLSWVLAVPVTVFSAADYWRSAWNSLRQKRLSIEVPIAAGIAALFGQSTYEVLSGRGEGYFDSLAGLLFFLLCGRVFQHKAFDRMTFDRDYRAFFPLSVVRIRSAGSQGQMISKGEERVSLSQISVGDRLRIRHGELIPADARLVRGEAWVDYSFVTGEAEPVTRKLNETLYAGGVQRGGTLEIETIKPTSQSYLTSLWDQEAFRKDKDDTFNTLTNRYSIRFTWLILAIAVGSAVFWSVTDPARAIRAFVGVLIVACPCALALAAPFTLGAAVRALGHRGIFLRNAQVVEALARINAVVFDKTGTLTTSEGGRILFHGEALDTQELCVLKVLSAQSSHPLSRRICGALDATSQVSVVVENFREETGNGLSARLDGVDWMLGSAAWFREEGVVVPEQAVEGSTVHVAAKGVYRGHFVVSNPLRPEMAPLFRNLAPGYELALLSGDNAREEARFRKLLGEPATLQFNQSPSHKLEFVRSFQDRGRSVMMVGDGLNDAGALRQSDVGVAVVEKIGTFSPASDVILDSSRLGRLEALLRFSRNAIRLVRVSFGISTVYNVVGLSVAAAGQLSPVVCAVLMPLSSVTVVAFAVLAVNTWSAHADLGPHLKQEDLAS